MIKLCDNNISKKMVEEYIGEEYYKCLYLYMDLKKYGINFENVKTWIQLNETKEVTSVFLMYYNGLHIYSKNKNFNIKELSEFIVNLKPTMICGEKKSLKLLERYFINNSYKFEEGYVRKLNKDISSEFEGIQKAQKEDFIEIARLIYEDEDLGSSYELESLEKQLYERNYQGFVRNYIIKEENKVIAHAGTGAEDDKVAMLGYVITHKDYRGKGLATQLCSKVCKDLQNEHKDVFLINYSNESTRVYDKIGFEICCEWEKIFLDLK